MSARTFSTDPDLGAKAYAEALRMRAALKASTPKPSKAELHAIHASTHRLRHDSARHN